MVATYLARGKPVMFDTETTGLDPRAGFLVSLQFKQQGFPSVMVDVRHEQVFPVQVALKPLLESKKLLIVGQNIKFDYGWVRQHLGLRIPRLFDTRIAEQVLRGLGVSEYTAREGTGLHLKALAARYIPGYELSKEERPWFIDLDKRPEWDEPLPDEQIAYSLTDVDILEPIFEAQIEALKEAGLNEAMRLEMRALPALAEMEHSGILIDVPGWRAVIAEKALEAQQYESEVLEVFGPAILQARAEKFDAAMQVYQEWEAARDEEAEQLRIEYGEVNRDEPWGKFKIRRMQAWREANPNPSKPKPDTSTPNLGSVKQLLDAFRVLEVPARNTDSDTLTQLEDDYPAVALLLRWRRAVKFEQSFGESLLKFVGPDGRIHPEYQLIGAGTDRMSCTRPNWQQIPSKGDGKKLRALVKAAPGNVLLVSDFSNIELRILADLSGASSLLDMFNRGIDVHAATARMMFPDLLGGVGDDAIKAESKRLTFRDSGWTLRDVAKTINFGLVYGMSPSKLSRTLRIPLDQAKALFDKYFALFPEVRSYLDEVKRAGLSKLVSKTLSGWTRRYELPPEPVFPFRDNTPQARTAYYEAREEHKRLRARIERQSMNTPIQGTSAAITKLAVARVYETMDSSFARLVAVVHDELVLEAAEGNAERAAEMLASAMDIAQHTYLKRVALPRPEVVTSDHWAKE